MKKRFLFLLIFCFGMTFLHSQNANHSFHLDYQYNILNAENSIFETRFFTLVDSVTFVSEDGISESSFDFSTKSGVRLGWQLSLPISKSIRFVTGLGLNNLRFHFDENFVSRTNLHTNPDTIKLGQPSSFSTRCHTFINSSSDFNFDSDIQHKVLYLNIPFMVETRVLNEQLLVQIGANISTPLFTQVKRSILRSEVIASSVDTEGNDHNTYKLFLENEKDRTGNGFKNFIPSLSLNFAYRVWKNLSVQAGLRQSFTSHLSGTSALVFSNTHPNTTLISFSGGIRIDL